METHITPNQRIINALIINSSFTENSGLFQGKMGAAIFSFLWSRHTQNLIYKEYAERLIDEISEEISLSTPTNFENGLSGIGWGFDFLSRNRFIEEDEGGIFEDFDRIIFQESEINSPYCSNFNTYFGIGLYSLSRPPVYRKKALQLLKMHLDYLLDNTSDKSSNVSSEYILSVLHFICKIKEGKLIMVEFEQIVSLLPEIIYKFGNKPLIKTEFYFLKRFLDELNISIDINIELNNQAPSTPELTKQCIQHQYYMLLFTGKPDIDNSMLCQRVDSQTIFECFLSQEKLTYNNLNEISNGIGKHVIGCALGLLNNKQFPIELPEKDTVNKGQIILLTKNSRASQYGIGTYLNELCSGISDTFTATIVHLESDISEFEIYRKNGIKHIHIPKLVKLNSPVYNNRNNYVITTFLQLFIENRNNIVFHFNTMSDYELAKSLKKVFSCKLLLVVHYMEWSFALKGNVSKLRKILSKQSDLHEGIDDKVFESFERERNLIDYVDHVVCLAKYSKEIVCNDYRIEESKVSIINNGLSDTKVSLGHENKLRLKDKYLLHSNEKIILFAGRLDEIKGVSFLIKAYKIIIKHIPNSRLWIVGDGAYNPLFKDASAIWNKICFTGKVGRKDLYELCAIADVGVIPSLFEPFGYIALEMMMHELPVVATSTGGLEEIIVNGQSGFKVEISKEDDDMSVDIDDLAQKIIFLLNNQKESNRMGHNARKRFLEKYGSAMMCKKMANCYLKLTSSIHNPVTTSYTKT